jgi:hypothetical protein
MSKCGFVVLYGLCLGLYVLFAPPAKADLTAQQKHLVKACNAMLLYTRADNYEAALKAQKQLDRTPRSTLRRQLEPCLKQVPVGSGAYQSVAFVLAYYGIDVTENARRMLIYRPVPKDYKDVGRVAEDVYYRLAHIYSLRHRNAYILERILSDKSDGAGATAVRGVRLRFLVKYPETVLRVVSRKPANLKLLARDVAGEGGKEERRILLRMSRHHDKTIKTSARYCLQRMRDQRAGASP